MACKGFACPLGLGNVPFAYCVADCRENNGDRCHPLPLLKAFMSAREVVPATYSVTQLNLPSRQVWLDRNVDYYVPPMGQLWMAFGTATHILLERGYDSMPDGPEKSGMIVERRMDAEIETPFGVAHLRGTPDVVAGERLDDWKSTKERKVKELKIAAADGNWAGDEYFVQLNTYRAMWYPEVKSLRLVLLIKDKTWRSGLNDIEYVNVPLGDVENVRDFVKARVTTFMENDLHPEKVPPCGDKDTWGGRKCAGYCSVSGVCPQYRSSK